MERILYNAIMTPDGTILESWSPHDFVTHTDKNGNFYFVDGGLQGYNRRSAHGDEVELTQVYKPHDHAHNRKYYHLYEDGAWMALYWVSEDKLRQRYALVADNYGDIHKEMLELELEWRGNFRKLLMNNELE